MIEAIGEYRTGKGRPAMLYCFRPDVVAEHIAHLGIPPGASQKNVQDNSYCGLPNHS